MKRYLFFLVTILLVACAKPADPVTEPVDESIIIEVKVIEMNDLFNPGGALVATLEEPHGSLAVLSQTQLDGLEVKPGDILAVTHDGIVLESFPVQFGSVRKVEKLREEPDQVGLICRQFTSRAEADPALTEGSVELGVDIRNADNLREIEKRAVLWKLESQEFTIIEGTFDELKEQGYILPVLAWKDNKGSFFRFATREVNEDKTKVVFDTQLWVSGKASLGSNGVTAIWEKGVWTETGGEHYISERE